jgi:DNA-binding CsgD family transcriptional regulator
VQVEFNLSQREAEILHWVAQGKTNVEIALILHISSFTVKNHMKRVFQKLNVTNRAQAVSKLMPLASNAEN